MDHLQVNLPNFLSALLWGCEPLINNERAIWHRTCLVVSDEVPALLQRLYRPPSVHDKSSARGEGARESVGKWAEDLIVELMDEELKQSTEDYQQPENILDFLTIENLSKLKYSDIISRHQKLAPLTWRLLRRISYTPKQEKRNCEEYGGNVDVVSTIFTPDVLANISIEDYDDDRAHNIHSKQPLRSS